MSKHFSRRDFVLGTSSLGLTLLTPHFFPLRAEANLIERERNVLLVVFLRGGFDGLSVLCPTQGVDRQAYEAARPNIGVPLGGPDGALPLTDSFALNRAAQPLASLFNQKQLAFVHACGLATPSRSHFAAQSMLDLGNAKLGEFNNGWLTRFLQKYPCRTAAIGSLRPASLLGQENLMLIPRLKGLGLDGSITQQRHMRGLLRTLYSNAGAAAGYGVSALNMLDEIEDLSLQTLAKNIPDLPSGEIAQKFALAAQLIQHDRKLGLLTIDVGGWDTHRQQGTNGEGYFAKQLGALSKALADFHSQTFTGSNAWVTTVVFSEFGRRLKENASRGTDHGHGNLALLCGPKVKGGTLQGVWPGLTHEKLFERSDLAMTTDLRQVLHEFLRVREASIQFDQIFAKPVVTTKLDLFHPT